MCNECKLSEERYFYEVLKLIVAYYTSTGDLIWTYSTKTNLASQKAFLRAEYEFASHYKMNLLTKIIRLVDQH